MSDAVKSYGRRLLACVALLSIFILLSQTSAADIRLANKDLSLPKYYDISGIALDLKVNPWHISLTADQTAVKVGSPVQLTATVYYNGTLQKNVMVVFETASGGYSWSETKFTDASGRAYATIKPPAAGAYQVYATVRMQDGTGFKQLDSEYVIVNVQNKPVSVQTNVSPESVNVNADADIKVTVKDVASMAPIGGATVSLTKSGGRLVPASGTTGPDGTFAATFTPDAAGAYTINVSVSAAGYDVWQGVINAQGASRPLNVTVETTPQKPAAGSKVTVRVVATSDNVPVSNADVNITVPGAQITPATTKTGPDGAYLATFVAGQPGTYTLTAEVTADGYVTTAKTAEVSVSQASDLMMLICPGAIVLGIVLIILIFLLLKWLKSDLKVAPKKSKIPADGTTKTPVRVQLVNGFGMAKKTGRDVEVELESTAGTIKSVVIPEGKEYVDAELTSAKEFGPVEITAKANGKRTIAGVDFVLENGRLEVAVEPSEVPADGKSSASVTVSIKDGQGSVVAPLEEKTIDLKTTLGTIGSPVKVPARAQSVSTSLTSGEVSGIAVVTASTNGLRGEGKVTLKGTPKRFCMHCGNAMSLEASQCPKCGQKPPSGVDTKQCPVCSTVIPEAAKFCYHCGAAQPEVKK